MRWCLLVLFGLLLGAASGAVVDRLALVMTHTEMSAAQGQSH
jgi:hypothetical protein